MSLLLETFFIGIYHYDIVNKNVYDIFKIECLFLFNLSLAYLSKFFEFE